MFRLLSSAWNTGSVTPGASDTSSRSLCFLGFLGSRIEMPASAIPITGSEARAASMFIIMLNS